MLRARPTKGGRTRVLYTPFPAQTLKLGPHFGADLGDKKALPFTSPNDQGFIYRAFLCCLQRPGELIIGQRPALASDRP